jgi:hypothetical protein
MELPKLEDFENIMTEIMEEDRIIGNYYFIIKNYKTEILLFYAKLKEIKKNVGTTCLNASITYYYFEGYEKINKLYLGFEIYYENIENIQFYTSIDHPYTSYNPENLHEGILFSTKFYKRKKMDNELKKSIILYSFNKIKNNLEMKTHIPLHVIDTEIGKYLFIT